MRLNGSRHSIVLISATALILIGGGLAAFFSMRTARQTATVAASVPLRHASIVLANQTPFIITAAVHLQTSSLHQRTEGWYGLNPGEIKTLEYDFEGEPNFQVYAESRDPGVIRWLHRRAFPGGIMYFDGPDGASSAHLVNSNGGTILDENPEAVASPPPGMQTVSFLPVTVSSSGRAIQKFRDPLLYGLVDTTGLPVGEDDQMRIISSRVSELLTSINRQRICHAKFPSFQLTPFLLGVDLRDVNGRGELGVAITGVVPTTIFGDPVPFRRGDIITGLSGSGTTEGIQNVFAYEDIAWLLFLHGTDLKKGIATPIRVRFLRGKTEYVAETTYRFNLACRSCWPVGELSDLNAFATGALNGKRRNRYQNGL